MSLPDKITTCVRFSSEPARPHWNPDGLSSLPNERRRLYAFFAGVDLVATVVESESAGGVLAVDQDPGLPHHCRALAAGAVTLTLTTPDFDFLASEYAPRGALRRADLMDPVL